MADKNTSNAGNNGAANNGADANVVRLRFNRSDLVKVLITDTDFVLVFVNGVIVVMVGSHRVLLVAGPGGPAPGRPAARPGASPGRDLLISP